MQADILVIYVISLRTFLIHPPPDFQLTPYDMSEFTVSSQPFFEYQADMALWQHSSEMFWTLWQPWKTQKKMLKTMNQVCVASPAVTCTLKVSR